jgi:catechol 2,3-dioxygenase-like lactoylglutathione lyase family enzyme
MIKGVHAMFYTSQAEKLRAFFRDKLGLPFTDVGEGWLIFDVPDAELAAHPSDDVDGGRSGTHNISFYCDDIHKTVAELKSRGVEFTAGVVDEGYGLVTHFKVPGGFAVQLYQPKYERRSVGKSEARSSIGRAGAAGQSETRTKTQRNRSKTRR